MSSIHADLGNTEKSLGFGTVAASLCPNAPDTWLNIGKAYVVSDPKLALACLKRCLRLRESVDAFVHLALAYEECDSMLPALQKGWEKAWELRRSPTFQSKERLDCIAQPLAKAYYRQEKWEQAREVLEACIEQPVPLTTEDKNLHKSTVFFLSDVLLGPLRMFRACVDMILKYMSLDQSASKLPLPDAMTLRNHFKQRYLPEILKNLAVSLILVGRFDEGVEESSEKIFRGSSKAESLICVEAIYAVLEQPYDTFHELIIEIVDALIQMSHLAETYRMLNRLRQNSFDKVPWQLQLRQGKVAYRQQKYEEAVACLVPILDNPEIQLPKTEENNLRITVAEIHHTLGNFDDCSKVLMPMSFSDLSSVKKFPAALSTQKRKQIFMDLCKEIRENAFSADFVPRFTYLVHDCELDILRVDQLRINDRTVEEQVKEESQRRGYVRTAPHGARLGWNP